nr:hypothetical protein [uncultured Sphingomonas sp.]
MQARGRLFALTFPPTFLLAGCSDTCANEIISRHTDPGSDLVAYVFKRDCGATTDYATNVAIGRRSENPADAAVIFTADADHGAALQEVGGAIWLRAAWTAPHTLSIAYAEKSRVFTKLGAANGARISYRASSPVALPPAP